MRSHRYTLVDVFTDRPLTGNQLAVFGDARALPEALLQPVAREMSLSETVFVYPAAAGGHARIRIFTTRRELPFAGHPVLGAAFVLGDGMAFDEVRLETGAGIIPIKLLREGPRPVFGTMRQPVPRVEPAADPAPLLAALGVARSRLLIEVYDNGVRHVYVTLDSEAAVAALTPDLNALARLPYLGVSCLAGRGTRWKTRMFAPADGVPEDPATGSAAGPLACHLARHGEIPWGQEIEIAQGEEIARPSTLYARALGGPQGIEAVEVGGRAVIIGRGELRL